MSFQTNICSNICNLWEIYNKKFKKLWFTLRESYMSFLIEHFKQIFIFAIFYILTWLLRWFYNFNKLLINNNNLLIKFIWIKPIPKSLSKHTSFCFIYKSSHNKRFRSTSGIVSIRRTEGSSGNYVRSSFRVALRRSLLKLAHITRKNPRFNIVFRNL